jgi:diaminopimelate decarboxylase
MTTAAHGDATGSLPPGALPRSVIDVVNRLNGPEAPVSAYIYRPEVAAERAAQLRGALPAWAEVFYAVKANAFPPVVRALAGIVEGFEVASREEAELGAAVGASANGVRPRLVASGPGKTESTLARLLELGVEAINVESVLELRRLARLAEERGTRVCVTLRVSPRPVRISPTITLGRTTTPFGIDEEQLADALAAASATPSVEVIGFHFHVVCNNLNADAHAAYVRWCLEWSGRTAARHGVDLRVIDVGGGLGVPERAHEEELDLDALAASLATLRPPSGTRVVFEPGRWLVDDCGFYAAEVTDLKHTNGTWFAVLRGGIHHFLRPAAYGTPHTFAVIARDAWPYPFPRPEVRAGPVTVVGELCTPADVLARAVPVHRLRAGDVLVFPRAGSYGWEMSIQEFLGHPRAARVVAPAEDEKPPIRARTAERG